MFRIQTLNKIALTGLSHLPKDKYEHASELANPDAILVRSQKMHDMEIPVSVKSVARAGAGVNNIPVDKCTEKGIVVFNTPGANANGVKEITLAALFLSSRNIVGGIEWAKSLKGKGDEVSALVEKGKSNYGGGEIKGKTLGVIGLGAIGVMVANDAEALGMDVVGYDPFISVEAAWGLSRSVRKAISLDSLIAEADYISLHIPLNDSTKGLINKDKLAIAKKGVKFLNFARGGLVNNVDLREAIAEGKVSSYVTDFPDDELLGIDAVIPIPHLGASTDESEDNCAVMAVNQTKNFLEKGDILNSVNFPDCSLPQSGARRLLVANRNVPKIIGQITNILADNNINIADMINKSKGDWAYNIIDIDCDLPEKLLKSIKSIESVVMVRLI